MTRHRALVMHVVLLVRAPVARRLALGLFLCDWGELEERSCWLVSPLLVRKNATTVVGHVARAQPSLVMRLVSGVSFLPSLVLVRVRGSAWGNVLGLRTGGACWRSLFEATCAWP